MGRSIRIDEALTWLVVNEAVWLPVAMATAGVSMAVLLRRARRRGVPARPRVLAAMNLFFGVMIATMAAGHLLAVTTKLTQGTLAGRPSWLYAIGLLLGVPAGLVVRHTRTVLESNDHGRTTVSLNAWLAMTLLALGLHNAPLAAPGLLNVGYHLHSHRLIGWTIVGAAIVLGVGLFTGSLTFLASGQTFEQFSGIE